MCAVTLCDDEPTKQLPKANTTKQHPACPPFLRTPVSDKVQLCVLGATNLSSPSSSIFATVSFRGTEISRTETVSPHGQAKAVTNTSAVSMADDSGRRSPPKIVPRSTVMRIARETSSHRWTKDHSNACVIPLPEEDSERRGVEVEINLWESGTKGKDRGEHLGQVRARLSIVSPNPARFVFARRAYYAKRSHAIFSSRRSPAFALW